MGGGVRNGVDLEVGGSRSFLLGRQAPGRIKERGSPFADRICEVVLPKYNRRFDTGKIEGYGRKMIA